MGSSCKGCLGQCMAPPHMITEDVVTHRRLLMEREHFQQTGESSMTPHHELRTQWQLILLRDGGNISLGGGRPPVDFSCSCEWTLSHTSSQY